MHDLSKVIDFLKEHLREFRRKHLVAVLRDDPMKAPMPPHLKCRVVDGPDGRPWLQLRDGCCLPAGWYAVKMGRVFDRIDGLHWKN